MQHAHYTSLLPDVFRHKTSRVRVQRPQVILLDFHGTISERRWEDHVIYPYTTSAIGEFLQRNWSHPQVQGSIAGLKNESFELGFRYKYEDAPVIEDTSAGVELTADQLANQMADFLRWQINNRHKTKETQTIERLVWLDGFKRHKIHLPVYDDVPDRIKLWKEQLGCQIYVASSIDADSLKLLFENTDKGNLGQYLSGYVSAKRQGDKLISETYRQFYHQVKSQFAVGRANSPARSPGGRPTSPRSSTSGRQISSPGSSTRIGSTSSPSDMGTRPKPILFVTDSGQEAKAASQANEAFECLLINRPGNKRIRTYYLSLFSCIDSFNDIEFV